MRGRVMLVGEHPRFDELERALHQETLRASTIYDAIGQLADPPGMLPIATVVIADDELLHGPSQASEALRRIDPSVQLVLLGQRGGVSPSGFDATFGDGTGLDDLVATIGASLFDEPPRRRSRESGQDHTDDRPREAPREPQYEAPREPQYEAPREPQYEAPREAQHEALRESAHAPAPPPIREPVQREGRETTSESTREAARETRLSHGEALGDVDLVEAILTSAVPMSTLAVRLVQEQTGWTDLEYLEPDEGSANEHCASIERDGDVFGWLHCASQARASLAPWADWLSRWLALDEAYRSYRSMAFSDDLTGAYNRRFFEAFMDSALPEARARRRPVTVMVFDLDNFKQYNDQFGHEAGDLVLTETVRLLQSVIRTGDRVCRIGGDEFVVVFADLDGPRSVGSTHPDAVEDIARRFQDQICSMRFPKLGVEAPGSLSISAGIATFPWDGNTSSELLRIADHRALESKRKGKNFITFGTSVSSDHSSPFDAR
jgi:diguanylate cyclase (GGDEF)-like protein